MLSVKTIIYPIKSYEYVCPVVWVILVRGTYSMRFRVLCKVCIIIYYFKFATKSLNKCTKELKSMINQKNCKRMSAFRIIIGT